MKHPHSDSARLPKTTTPRFSHHSLALDLTRESGLQWWVDNSDQSAFIVVEDMIVEVIDKTLCTITVRGIGHGVCHSSPELTHGLRDHPWETVLHFLAGDRSW